MIVVIQCAARKRKDAGHLQTRDGKRVVFISDPTVAPTSDACIYARPDDPSDHGGSWREYLLRYSETPQNNPLVLLPAFELYKEKTYQALANQLGVDRTFILSAGWGLIPASFLTPSYDITFLAKADPWKRRRHHAVVSDFSMLPIDAKEPIVFLGGKDYLPLFLRLTAHISSPRIVLFNSSTMPNAPDCRLVQFTTKRKTNWHYECASALLRGLIDL